MAAEDISGSAVFMDAVPNLNMKMCYAAITSTEDDDYIDFANIGMKEVYMAIALVANATEACAVSGTVVTFTAGGTDAIKVIAIGI